MDHVRFGLLTFPQSTNTGDAIQSIAARRFLPAVDFLLDRESLHRAEIGEPVAVIGNAWYAHNPAHWPPAPGLELLPISMHFSPAAAASFLSDENRGYLVERGPVGARDLFTLAMLRERGIDAYFSGCMTLTMRRPPGIVPSHRIVLCDVDGAVADHVARATGLRTERLSHFEIVEGGIEAKLVRAARMLRSYAAAACVVTSRLHAALPALAMGTPVHLLTDADDAYRFDGLLDLVHNSTTAQFLADAGFDPHRPPKNVPLFEEIRHALSARVQNFVRNMNEM